VNRNASPVLGRNLADLLDLLGRLVEKSSSVRTQEALIPELLTVARKFSGLASAAIYLPVEGGAVLQLAEESSDDPAPEVRPKRLAPTEGPTGKAFQTRKAVVIPDAKKDPANAAWVRPAGMRMQVSLPLESGGQVFGVLDLSDPKPRKPTPEGLL